MHERFDRVDDTKGSSDRSFGVVMGVVFLIVTTFPVIFSDPPGDPIKWAGVVAAGFLFFAWIRPAALRPLNLLWMKFGHLLSVLVSPIAITLLFYLSVAPIGLAFRLMRKDPLRLRRDPAAASYWIARDPPGPSGASMKNQF